MPELPALPFKAAQRRDRITRPASRPRLQGPGAGRQAERLDDSLARLTAAFEAGRLRAEADPGGLEPDLVLVMEIAGELNDFFKAISKVDGLEFLSEEIEDKVDPDEFVAVDSKGKKHRYSRQLFLVASNRVAWEQLLSLWQRYQKDEPFPRGLTPFRHVFERLRELRPWNDSDRLERSGALDVWRHELAGLADEPVTFEAELWLRSDEAQRKVAVDALRADLVSAGGELLTESVHTEIGYHGALGQVPASRLQEVIQSGSVSWLRTESVRFFHAVGQIATDAAPEEEVGEWEIAEAAQPVDRPPRVALLDGLPLAGHEALAGRILLDDPENWEETTPARRRLHATSLGSVLIHGDLSGDGPPLREPIYIRPILRADAPDWLDADVREELPRDRLAVDVVHAAVARLFEDEAQAPEVRVIVIAIGDAAIQFDQFISPLARLLDWLADRYGVLFILSAGNHLAPIELPADCDLDNAEEVGHEILCELQRQAPMRRLLCPGESVNAITVGAAHSDLSEALVDDGRLEPIHSADLANTISALGSGYRRSVKPDVLFPGGRQTLNAEPGDDGARTFSVPVTRRAPGVRHATVGPTAGDLRALSFATGTSLATALAGHRAGEFLATLDEQRALGMERFPAAEFDAVLLKASLAHASRWGAARALIDSTQEDLGRGRSRMAVGRLVGYGASSPQSPLICDDHRVTVIGAGRLVEDKADVFALPLPQSLAAQTIRRRITLTLAWITPIHPAHRHYRRAALKLQAAGHDAFLGRRTDADANMVVRGTLQHEIFESEAATPYSAGDSIELLASCRGDAGTLEGSVPYALFATIEVPETVGLSVYEEVREALRAQVQVQAR